MEHSCGSPACLFPAEYRVNVEMTHLGDLTFRRVVPTALMICGVHRRIDEDEIRERIVENVRRAVSSALTLKVKFVRMGKGELS